MLPRIMTEIASTSSIGAAWPPVEGSNQRMRGFYTEVVQSEADLSTLITECSEAQKRAEAHTEVTRLGIRAVMRNTLIPAFGDAMMLEGALPIGSTPGRSIVYAAWNDVGRRASDEDLAAHYDTIAAAQAREPVTDSPYLELIEKGYVPKIIDGRMDRATRLAQAGRFLELYGKFDFDEGDVRELLTNPNNTIAYIQNEAGDIISTVLAERGSIPIMGQPNNQLTIAEITEAVTDPDMRGGGLYRGLSGLLVQCMVDNHIVGDAPLDTLYGESNLSAVGVLVSAHRNGRRFSIDDAPALGVKGYPNFGILQQNVAVNDGAETRAYNDFALTYRPLPRL